MAGALKQQLLDFTLLSNGHTGFKRGDVNQDVFGHVVSYVVIMLCVVLGWAHSDQFGLKSAGSAALLLSLAVCLGVVLLVLNTITRSEERRVGKECGRRRERCD